MDSVLVAGAWPIIWIPNGMSTEGISKTISLRCVWLEGEGGTCERGMLENGDTDGEWSVTVVRSQGQATTS